MSGAGFAFLEPRGCVAVFDGMQTGHRKPLDTEINLVPFIDLMAVTIAFLLITAVWTQTGAQPVASSGQGTGDAAPLVLALTARGVALDGVTFRLDDLARLEKALREREARTATVEVDDGVLYEDLVHVIDACRGARVDVAVSPAAG